MSNFYPKKYRNRQQNNYHKNRQENCLWNAYGYSNPHDRDHNSRSPEWFHRNWQQMHLQNVYTKQNRWNYYDHNRNWDDRLHTEREPVQPKHMKHEISQEIEIKHINKFIEYLEDEEKIYLDFKGLDLQESSYVYNLHNLSYDKIENYGFKLKRVAANLCDILKSVQNKLNFDVMCEECNDQRLRNVTYTKVFKKSNDEYTVDNNDFNQECNGNSEQNNSKIKMILKEDLYRNLIMDVEDNTSTLDIDNNDWTNGFWKKSNEIISEENDEHTPVQNTLHKRMTKLLETYSTPVESNKAKRMMEKMGWTGGALGVKGEGIIDPIIPNVTFKQGAGLGHTHEPKRKRSKKRNLKDNVETTQPDVSKSIFKTNVLQHIVVFLCDDESTEICFDPALSRSERSSIHYIIECLRSEVDIECKTTEQMRLVSEIHENMSFTLESESEGEGMNRKLHLFKTAPENIYLITPKDLDTDEENYELTDKSQNMNTDEPSVLPVQQQVSTENTESLTIVSDKDGSNSSVDSNIKEDGNKSIIRWQFLKESLMTYIEEFCKDEVMSELRFLGQFNTVDMEIINWFMADLAHNLQNDVADDGTTCQESGILFVNEFYNFDVYLKEREGSILYVLRKTKKTANCTQETCE